MNDDMEFGLRQYIIDIGDNILNALKKINDNGRGIVFVCDSDNTFYGTITDGDVRRHLINGGEINAGVTCIMNEKPYVISAPMDNSVDYIEIMRKKYYRNAGFVR